MTALASIVDAKAPDKIFDICDVLLVGFGSEDDHGEPASEVGKATDPSQFEEVLQLGFHNFRFVYAIADQSTGDWVGGAGIDAEFVVEDGSVDAGGREQVLEAKTKEKLVIRAGPEFGELEGHLLRIHKALYALRTSGVRDLLESSKN